MGEPASTKLPRQLSRGWTAAIGARRAVCASTKLPRQLSRGLLDRLGGAWQGFRLNEVASAVKPRPHADPLRRCTDDLASTKLPRQLSRGLRAAVNVLSQVDLASTKLPRQLSRGLLERISRNDFIRCLNEVASAVKPRHLPFSEVGGSGMSPQRSCLGS